jgi:GxxExxY protein
MKDVWELCDSVRGTAFAIHSYLRHGHIEKVYENALAHRLRKLGIGIEQQPPILVLDEDGTQLGSYFADLLVQDILVVEIKASKSLVPEHTAQLLGYLRATKIEHGLLLNFGAARFQARKLVLTESDKLVARALPE